MTIQNVRPKVLRFLKRLFLSLPFVVQGILKKLFVLFWSDGAILYLRAAQQDRVLAKEGEFQKQLQNYLNSKDNFEQEIETEKFIPRVKSICFYLPQFYSFPENDLWWGRGFTEWTNVTRVVPQFKGHLQPRLPADLGFYDLRQLDTHFSQVELAKKYGIFGFCYYYYWFDGKRLLDKPLDLVLNNERLDFPFCICWANENWSRRWDGNDKQILIGQTYQPNYETEIIDDMIPIISDKRYIRVDGKPLIIIYRPSELPSAKELANKWRKRCLEKGIGEIFIASTHSFDCIDPREFGFDAAIEFAPNNSKVSPVTSSVEFFNPSFQGSIFDYSELVDLSKNYQSPSYLKFRGACPSWDNEPRKPSKGNIFVNSTPSLFGKWVEQICKYTDENMKDEQKFIFLNAWNEWAEGAMLEPDRYFGHAYLISAYRALKKFGKKGNEAN